LIWRHQIKQIFGLVWFDKIQNQIFIAFFKFQMILPSSRCSIEATSGAEVAGVREPTGLRRSKRRRAPEAQVAESRLVSETAARQDSNDKQAEVEGDEGDPTDVEADFEETTAMAMKDQMVQRQPLVAWTWTLRTHTGSLPPSQESYGRCQDDFSKGRARG
jgi:hypothetical protein